MKCRSSVFALFEARDVRINYDPFQVYYYYYFITISAPYLSVSLLPYNFI